MNNRGAWNKRGGWKNSFEKINGEVGIRMGRSEKNGKINSRGAPSIPDSRVLTQFELPYKFIHVMRKFFFVILIAGS